MFIFITDVFFLSITSFITSIYQFVSHAFSIKDETNHVKFSLLLMVQVFYCYIDDQDEAMNLNFLIADIIGKDAC